MTEFYTESQRRLQDEFETRSLADRLSAAIVVSELADDQIEFIESRDMFFLSTIDEMGFPSTSYKGGARGFVRAPNRGSIVFPSYDGNGMFMSMGNIDDQGKVGLLFIDFETPQRLRVRGDARLLRDGPMLASYPGAQLAVEVTIESVWQNCPRYVHKMTPVEQSPYVPDDAGQAKMALWKRIDAMQDVLSPDDQRAARQAGIITMDDYATAVAEGQKLMRDAQGRLRWLVMVGMSGMLVAVSAAANADILDAEDAAAIARELVGEAIADSAVGLSVAVAYGDEFVISDGFGLANVEHDVAVDAETTFRIGSITKQVTAAMVMRLVERGELGVDDPITQYVSYPVGDREVTVRHLLTHTSGIKSYTGIDAIMSTISLDRSHDELLAFVREEPFDFAPGDQYLYNNTGYYLLGMILEAVTGKTYEELVADLADELSLERTFYGSNTRIIPNRAQGYRLLDGELAHARLIAMTQPYAAGSMLSSAADLVRWQRALIKGEVVSASSYATMISPYVLNDGSATTYGFGLGFGDDHGDRVIQHGGGIYGFNAMLTYYPETEVSISVISNGPYGAARLARDIGRAIHGTTQAVDDLPVEQAEGRMLAGSYRAASGLELSVTFREGEVFIQAAGQDEARVLRQADGEYRASFDPDVRVIFELGDPSPGFTLIQGSEMVFERID